MFNVEEELKKLPANPGVYLMRDKGDSIIYIGKAISLKNRVRSYFRASTKRYGNIEKMITQIDRFEYIITDSELEALVLENNLIKEHRPKYNTLLKDDKTYPYIKITIWEDFPRVLFSRQMKKDKGKYFGPFTSSMAVKNTIELMNKLYKIRTCNQKLPENIGKNRPCLNYHMKQCLGPCQGYITKEEYQENLNKAIDFLNGNFGPIIKEIESKMQKASDDLAFEEAIQHRELLNQVKSIAQKQKITNYTGDDKDIIALAKEDQDAVVQVFFIREGKLIGREHFFMTNVAEENDSVILESFIKQFYAGTPFIPKEIILQNEISEIGIIEQWLSAKRGSRAYIKIPKIGDKERLVELAKKNAMLVLSQDREKIKREEARTIGAVKEIGEILDIASLYRMEAFDISNISGFNAVGSMVVYEKGKPKRSDYRKFKIKTITGSDDYGSMREVLTRRFLHGMEENKQLNLAEIDKKFGSFTKFPDLILMDGGKGQVNIALEVLGDLKLNIPVCGMVKDDNHRTRGLYYHNQEIQIDTHSEGFKMITRIQDEAHRFAIEYHRSLRSKTQIKSELDDIPGVGSTRRKALMKYFKSIDEIRKAEIEELNKVNEIPEHVAKSIYEFFRKR